MTAPDLFFWCRNEDPESTINSPSVEFFDDRAEEWDQPQQPLLFDIEQPWEKVWKGMPEFIQEDLSAWKSLTVNFATPGDLALFATAIRQALTANTRSVWFPPAEIGRYANKRYSDEP